MTIHPCFLGCDISKEHLDVFDPLDATCRRLDNTEPAIADWLDALAGRDARVVFEATGPLDRRLCALLAERGIGFSRVNPERARAFAKASGRLAKTDAIDARMLADMGQALLPDRTPLPSPARLRLAAVSRRRDQLVAMRQQEKVRLKEALESERPSLERHIAWLTAEIKELEAAREALIREDPELARLARLLRTIPGIGPVAAATLLALMPELGSLTPKAAAALAGLAPFNVDSGRMRGKRTIRGGRRRVRKALYMAAVTARRSSSRLAAFAQTLEDKKKPYKLANIALARKILTIANAVIRDQKPYCT